MPNQQTWYDVLKIKRTANHQEIVQAWERLSQTWNPNQRRLTLEAKEQYQPIYDTIQQAYGILSTSKLKSQYDQYLTLNYPLVSSQSPPVDTIPELVLIPPSNFFQQVEQAEVQNRLDEIKAVRLVLIFSYITCPISFIICGIIIGLLISKKWGHPVASTLIMLIFGASTLFSLATWLYFRRKAGQPGEVDELKERKAAISS